MFNQRGQIHIILLVLLVVGFIIYANFSSESISKWFSGYKINPKSQTPSASKSAAPAVPSPTERITPLPVEPDTAPPNRFNVQPRDKSNLPPETRKTALSLETDEKAICRYGDVAGVSYDSMQGKFSQTNGTVHSVLITTLSEGGQYRYFIRCVDEKGNKNANDLAVSFGVEFLPDRTPPVLSNPSHQGDVLPRDTKEAVISISTDEPASCYYTGSMSGSFSRYDQTGRFHVKRITGLANGASYDFLVRCRDSAGNANTGDVLISFSVSK